MMILLLVIDTVRFLGWAIKRILSNIVSFFVHFYAYDDFNGPIMFCMKYGITSAIIGFILSIVFDNGWFFVVGGLGPLFLLLIGYIVVMFGIWIFEKCTELVNDYREERARLFNILKR